jgi:hypothetical protein
MDAVILSPEADCRFDGSAGSTRKGKDASKTPPKKVTFDKKSHKKAVPPPKGKDRGWEWTLVGPKPRQPHTKDVDGKHFRWCTYHDDKGSGGKWVTHTLALCKVRLALKAKKTGTPMGGTAAQMKVAGMVAILPEDDEY